MEPGHWAWFRQRAIHHAGAVRSYVRDVDYCEPRGPHETPRGLCDQCSALQLIREVVNNDEPDNSWYLSSSSDDESSLGESISSDEIDVIPPNTRFDMKGEVICL